MNQTFENNFGGITNSYVNSNRYYHHLRSPEGPGDGRWDHVKLPFQVPVERKQGKHNTKQEEINVSFLKRRHNSVEKIITMEPMKITD